MAGQDHREVLLKHQQVSPGIHIVADEVPGRQMQVLTLPVSAHSPSLGITSPGRHICLPAGRHKGPRRQEQRARHQ